MPVYYKISDAVKPAEERGISLGKSVLIDECQESRLPESEVFAKMKRQLEVMRKASEDASRPEVEGPLYFKDAWKMKDGIEKGKIPNDFTARAVQKAIAVNGWNSLSGKVVATPTGGSCGILPGVLLAAQEEWGHSDDELTLAMFAGAGMGIPIAYNGTLSGSVGGCQAECGSAAAMAAAALVDLRGGTPWQCANAFAIACKASMGLICDPIGTVSCPCVKRNGMYAAVAISAAYMALCEVESIIPPDEMLTAFCSVSLDVAKKFNKLEYKVGVQCTPFAASLDPKIFKH
ncbi:MAG: L-serine ammonia-lyase, iron-sulfur-dependent, subunit alpha [Clostridiaceae bacterium]|nr:L-serine ammonia-lyase, iron-sulfur-dependent, subunit alpha [Clostridiaceae bacterium]